VRERERERERKREREKTQRVARVGKGDALRRDVIEGGA